MTIIETKRLILHPFVADDLDEYHAQIYSDAQVMLYLPGGVPRPIEGTKKVLEFAIQHGKQYGYTLWAVVDKASEAFLGHCGLVTLQNGDGVELAYAFGKVFWGQGYASEAGRACLRFGFENAGLEQIIALAVPDNRASQRVMQKIGMHYQGMTDRYYGTSLILYSLAAADFRLDDSAYAVWE